MNTAYYRQSVERYGVGPTLYHAAYRAANSVAKVAIWDAVVLTPGRLERSFLEDPRQADGRMLDAAAMRPYVADKENALTDAFLDGAQFDRCHAFFDGDVLTSYGWYSTRPTPLTEIDGGLILHFDPSYAYMYNGFTRPKYRGLRLHALGMAAALMEYAKEGKKGLVSYVDSSNFASLKSCFRMGYERIGRIAILEVGGRHLTAVTRGCKPYGLYVETPSARAPGRQVAEIAVQVAPVGVRNARDPGR